MTQKIERWAFTSQELLDPSKCKRDDEFAVNVGQELPILVYRDGKCSNRWGDGTVGVPQIDREAAEGCLDELYTLDFELCVSEWRDVLTNDEGNFIRFADAREDERGIIEAFIDSKVTIVGACYCKDCHAGALVIIGNDGQTFAFCKRGGHTTAMYPVKPVPPCEWVPV